MTQAQRTLLIHAGCIALIAACIGLSLLIKGEGGLTAEARAALIGSALFLYGKLGFAPAGPVLDGIVAKLAERDPERVKRLTSHPPASSSSSPPPAAVPVAPSSFFPPEDGRKP